MPERAGSHSDSSGADLLCFGKWACKTRCDEKKKKCFAIRGDMIQIAAEEFLFDCAVRFLLIDRAIKSPGMVLGDGMKPGDFCGMSDAEFEIIFDAGSGSCDAQTRGV